MTFFLIKKKKKQKYPTAFLHLYCFPGIGTFWTKVSFICGNKQICQTIVRKRNFERQGATKPFLQFHSVSLFENPRDFKHWETKREWKQLWGMCLLYVCMHVLLFLVYKESVNCTSATHLGHLQSPLGTSGSGGIKQNVW